MMGRLLRWLPVAVARALLPDPPFECDNARCRVRPRATIYAAERVCAPGNYTCASCCDPDPNCRCGAGASGHSTAPTANATAVRLHLRAAFPDRAAQLAALSDAQAVEAFRGLAWRTPRCPAGYYECAGCCDRDADCACDGACDLGADADCALAYGAGGAKPDGWCPVWKSTSVSGARQFFTKSFLGDEAADLARSSGEEPASSRRRVDGVEDDAMIQHERAVKF